MRRLYLVRHGEIEANRLNIIQTQNKRLPFASGTGDYRNSNGIMQAGLLGKALANVEFQSIYTSPAIRAYNTTNLIAFNNTDFLDKILVESTFITVENKLLEVDQGDFDGMRADEITAQYPALYELYHRKPSHFAFPNGESMIEVKERVGQAIDQILNKSLDSENILVVSHGGTISFAFIHIFGLDMDRMYHAIRHHNCAFSVIEWPSQSSPPRIDCINNTSHLK